MKKHYFLKYFLCIVIFLPLFFASCPSPSFSHSVDVTDEPNIDSIAGEPKAQELWGTLTENIPNNIGNAFTADPKTTRTITWMSTHNEGEVIIDNNHYPSTSTLNEGFYFHRVDITGLEAGETYRYIAGSADNYSPVYSFATENENSSDGFSVLHITDPQIGSSSYKYQIDAEAWKRTIESAIEKCPNAAFVVNTGDVAENKMSAAVHYYFDYAQTIIANYAFVYSMGNNDSVSWYNQYFYTQDNIYEGVLYSFDYGNAHFVNIDSNAELTTAQLDWLENDLKNTDKKWKAAMMHEGGYGRKGSKSALTELFDKYNIDLAMIGHNHFYARSKPIDASGEDKKNGTVWIMPNAAGNKFNSKPDKLYLAVSEQPELPMFTQVKFTETNIFLNSYTVDTTGEAALFDTYALR